jgi:uncharacterized protein YjbJ (UPF0337 family)/uncharacterized membrane protein
MAQRVTAIFRTREDAERAADALVDMGADRSQISTIARGQEGMDDRSGWNGQHDKEGVVEPAREVGDSGAALTTTDAHDTGTGAVVGAVAGLAAGLLALTVPGIGLVLAAGPLALAAAGGAIAGGVYGSLRDIGIEEQHARGYEERVRGGHVLMTALVPSFDQGRTREILSEYGAEDISFNEDTSSMSTQFPAGESAMAQPAYTPVTTAEGSVATPVTDSMRDTTYAAPASSVMAGSSAMVGASAMGAAESNIAQGEAKQVEGEWRDRAADRTLNPFDDLAAKSEKAAGKLQEEYGEEEEVVHDRT